MKFYAECVSCLMASSLKKAASIKDERVKLEYALRICDIFRNADPETEASPIIDARIIRLRRDFLNLEDNFTEIKHSYNQLLLGLYPRLRARVDSAPDPLYAAIQLSLAGNYIDFGVLPDVNEERLLEMLDEASGKKVDETEYAHLVEDLKKPGELLFCHDNCGEIVLDKLLIETIKECYPGQKVVSVVRGGDILNDVTLVDAKEVGLYDVSDEVIANGVEDVAGTQLDFLPKEVYDRIAGAKLVIAKGQGNFETLQGCGMNVYYLFLCKCPRYTTWFGLERFSGVLANDRRLVLAE